MSERASARITHDELIASTNDETVELIMAALKLFKAKGKGATAAQITTHINAGADEDRVAYTDVLWSLRCIEHVGVVSVDPSGPTFMLLD